VDSGGNILLTFYNEQHRAHAGRMEMYCGNFVPCFETPERVDFVLAELERRNLGRIVTPQSVPLVSLERIHHPRYVEFLCHAWQHRFYSDPAFRAKMAGGIG
jgi:acetoin utilization deacetylase AcuC-like enzyme